MDVRLNGTNMRLRLHPETPCKFSPFRKYKHAMGHGSELLPVDLVVTSSIAVIRVLGVSSSDHAIEHIPQGSSKVLASDCGSR